MVIETVTFNVERSKIQDFSLKLYQDRPDRSKSEKYFPCAHIKDFKTNRERTMLLFRDSQKWN